MDPPPKRTKAASPPASPTNVLTQSSHVLSSSSTTSTSGPSITYNRETISEIDENTSQETARHRDMKSGDHGDNHDLTYTGTPHSRATLQMNIDASGHHLFQNASHFVIKDSTINNFNYGGSRSGEDSSSIRKHDGAISESKDSLIKWQDLKELKDRLLEGVKTVDSRATECIEGTRTRILTDVETKIDDCDGANIIWIRGAPGAGKSSISLTAKSRLRSQGRLVSYFRFDRNEAATTTPTALWRHVAYDLARRLPLVGTQLLQQLRDDEVDLESSMAVFTSLVEEPLLKLIDPPLDRPFVIVIDALDECGGFIGRSSPDRQVLLQILRRWPKLPNHFKLLVTGREEGDITRALSSISIPIHIPSGGFLSDNPQAQASIDASHDIHIYLEHRFQEIREPSLLPPDWPGKDMLANMVHRAAGNFMWATTVSNFVDSGLDPEDRLERVMDDTPESKSMEPLYMLYSTILETSFGHITCDSSEAEMLHAVLGTIVFAQRSLRDIEYTKLPTSKPMKPNMIALIRDRLNSVVGLGPTLRFVHKSLDDFLLSEECPAKYRIRMDESQRLLTELCLTTMTEELRFNMCGLETSCLKNVDMPNIDVKVREGISSLLSYSCSFWVDHLMRTPFDERIMGAVKEMIYDKLLYWFEAMSLLKEVNQVSYSLLSVLNWSNSVSDGKFREFICDAHRFIGAFIHPISQSAPHVYISSLPFAPEHSSVAKHFLPQFPHIIALSVGRSTDWSPCIFTSEHHKFGATSIAFSPDEEYFVSGSIDATICVCDSETGNLISGPFWNSGSIDSSYFDPDGRYVWAQCSNGQVVGWDIETGDEHLQFQAEEVYQDVIGSCCSNGGQNIVSVSRGQGTVTLWNANTGERLDVLFRTPKDGFRVAFSQDGCYMAWAGGDNMTIRIWKLADGSEIQGPSHSQPQFRHTEPISVLSFSVDGHFAVSGSWDGTILVWDAKTGDVVGHPLDTNKAPMTAIAYSHKNNLVVLASGNPGTVMVWNASTHEAILGPLAGHMSLIVAITLSRDGQRALTASDDGTVRMWDLGRREVVSVTHTTEGHRNKVWWVAFSPCGKKLASLGWDGTVRLWDASTGKPLLDPIDSLSDYGKIIFSPDGSQIVAFRSYDGTIQAWNTDTGEPTFHHQMHDPDREYTDIVHVAFRSIDQRLVTCSNHGVIRIWSSEDSSLTEDLSVSSPQPEDLTSPVEILGLSPNGLTAIVRDNKRVPCHYMWSTTTCQPLPLTFTDDEHIQDFFVTFSSSGNFFATSSMDTLRVWNTETGELAAAPSMLDGHLLRLVFSSDDCHIAFSYAYYTACDSTAIWILDVHTGQLVSGPWNGHSDSIWALAFSPDGEKLASGSDGGQIGIWNTVDLLGYNQASSGFLGVGPSMENGWVMDADGKLLFWVPKDHRSSLVWPGCVELIAGGGITTELDLERFRYGENWTECFRDGK